MPSEWTGRNARRAAAPLALVLWAASQASVGCSHIANDCDANKNCDDPPAGWGAAGAAGAGESGAGGEAPSSGGHGGAELCDPPCGGSTSHCDPAAARCVECLRDEHCSASAPLCDATSGRCIACSAPQHCTDAKAARCEAGSCAPCQTNDDCAYIPAKNVCDNGQCVQCTGLDAAACGHDATSGVAFVCDSLSHTCTANLEHSASTCQPCTSDAHCALGQLCVRQMFGEPAQEVGYFCHWIKGSTEHGGPRECMPDARPYVRTASGVVSIDGNLAEVCELSVSTCPAVHEFRSKDCARGDAAEHALCGFNPPNDALCVLFPDSSTYRCTMRCGSDDDCLPGFSCNTTALQRYCEL